MIHSWTIRASFSISSKESSFLKSSIKFPNSVFGGKWIQAVLISGLWTSWESWDPPNSYVPWDRKIGHYFGFCNFFVHVHYCGLWRILDFFSDILYKQWWLFRSVENLATILVHFSRCNNLEILQLIQRYSNQMAILDSAPDICLIIYMTL